MQVVIRSAALYAGPIRGSLVERHQLPAYCDRGIKSVAFAWPALACFPLTFESIRFQMPSLSFDHDGSPFHLKGVGPIARTLYERTIDFGAHPNERALMQTLQVNKNVAGIEIKSIYLNIDSPPLRLAFKTVAQVGVCALLLLQTVYSERYNIIGLSDLLRNLKKGL